MIDQNWVIPAIWIEQIKCAKPNSYRWIIFQDTICGRQNERLWDDGSGAFVFDHIRLWILIC